MTNNSPLPPNRSGVEPGAVDPIDEMLSALADAELAAPELAQLEDYAVDNDQTLDRLTAPFHSIKNDLVGLLDEPAPSTNRSHHLATALDAMDEPEVLSLAAARASRTEADDKLKRSQKLNRRLRQMSAVAAGFVVIAGIGVVALQGGLVGSDGTESAGELAGDTTETTSAAASAGQGESFSQSDAASLAADDGAMDESDDAMEESAMEEEAPDLDNDAEASPELSSGTKPILRFTTAVQDLTLDQLSEESGIDRDLIVQRSAQDGPVEAQCFEQAVENGIAEAEIQQTFIVEQADVLYELLVLRTEELEIFELPSCTQID